MHWSPLCREARLLFRKRHKPSFAFLIGWFMAATTKMKYLGHGGTINMEEFDCAVRCRASPRWLRCLCSCCDKKKFFKKNFSINVIITAGMWHQMQKVALAFCQRGIKAREILAIIDVGARGQPCFQIYRHCLGFYPKNTKLWFWILTDVN